MLDIIQILISQRLIISEKAFVSKFYPILVKDKGNIQGEVKTKKHVPEILVSEKFRFLFYYNKIERLNFNHFLSLIQNRHYRCYCLLLPLFSTIFREKPIPDT